MGKCVAYHEELRFDVRDKGITHVYVFIRAEGDCPHSVNGWHHKAFPSQMTVEDIFQRMWRGGEDPLMWPLKAPRNT